MTDRLAISVAADHASLSLPPLGSPPPVSSYRLTPMQQGLLFRFLSDDATASYLQQTVGTLNEHLAVDTFVQAVQTVAARHDAFRTYFRWKDVETPVQCVERSSMLPIRFEDWSELPETESQSRFDQCVESDRAERFDLGRAPLFRMFIAKLSDSAFKLVLTNHHIVQDGFSRILTIREIFGIYETLRAGGEVPPRPAPPSLREYVDWIDEQRRHSSRDYWREVFDGLNPGTSLADAFSRPTPDAARSSGHQHTWRLSRDLTERLRAFADRHEVTMNTVVQAVWGRLLGVYSGENAVVFGVTRACRRSTPNAQQIIGNLINTLPFRVDLDRSLSIRDWLGSIRQRQVELRQHEHSAMPDIRRLCEVRADQALFESILVFDRRTFGDVLRATGESWRSRTFDKLEGVDEPLLVHVYDGDELRVSMAADPALFTSSAVQQIARTMHSLFDSLVQSGVETLSDVRPLSEEESRQILFSWNDTHVAHPLGQTVVQMFRNQVRQSPDSVALELDGEQLTYGGLNERAEVLARHLRSMGVQPGALVAVCVERSLQMVVSVLGVLKAGGAYVPMDPKDPLHRIEQMIEDAAPRVVIACSTQVLPSSTPTVLLLDELGEAPPDCTGGVSDVAPTDLAYVVYTSGSTGEPKGVAINHRSLTNLVCWHHRFYATRSTDRSTQIVSPAFDGCIWELWPYLCAGATVHFAPDEVWASPARFQRWVDEHGITITYGPTALVEALLELDWPADTPLRLMHTGGDRITRVPAKSLPFRLFNHYGPTETTVVTTSVEIDPTDPKFRLAFIGKPIDNNAVYVLDEAGQPLPVDALGEIFVGGTGVGCGYHNRPVLTTERFVDNPFAPPGTMFRSGDLGRLRDNGTVEFVGRADNLVKLRGFRIELGEIEAALNAHDAVRQSVAHVQLDSGGGKRLVTFVVLEDPSVELSTLNQHLRDLLPAFMVPAAIIPVDTFSYTRSGKIDRRALPQAPQPAPTSDDCARSGWELELTRIWNEILGLESIGIHDDFFELGGDSLRAIRLTGRLESLCGFSLPLPTLFEAPTISELASRLSKVRPIPPNGSPEAGLVSTTITARPRRQRR